MDLDICPCCARRFVEKDGVENNQTDWCCSQKCADELAWPRPTEEPSEESQQRYEDWQDLGRGKAGRE